MRSLIVIFVLLILSACSTMQTATRPNSYYQDSLQNTASLKSLKIFSDPKKITNQDFQKLLRHRFKLAKINRVAVINLTGDYSWRFFSPQLAKQASIVQMKLYTILRKSKRVYDASPLPTLILSSQEDLFSLRVAAANYQADLLLVYRTYCKSYQKYKLFEADKTQSFCTVDALVLDIRTGLTPFAITSTNSFKAMENKTDSNFSETIKKAELQAIEKSLLEVGNSVVHFLASTH